MNMESVARQTLWRQMRAQDGQLRSLAERALLGRIWRFAHRHHRRLGAFVAVSVVSALLAVATPVLAGKVVDAIVRGGPSATIIALALVIAAVALAEAAVSLMTRWLSSAVPAAPAAPAVPKLYSSRCLLELCLRAYSLGVAAVMESRQLWSCRRWENRKRRE